jgi:plastocyanin
MSGPGTSNPDDGGAAANGCNSGAAPDMTGMNAVTISFGDAYGFAYSPACIRVRSGTTITFQGDFTAHPLVGGFASRSSAMADPDSPIHAPASGTATAFVAGDASVYPYYCANHFGSGMMGAIFISPS